MKTVNDKITSYREKILNNLTHIQEKLVEKRMQNDQKVIMELLELFQDYNIQKRINLDFNIDKIKKEFINKISPINSSKILYDIANKKELPYIWGLKPNEAKIRTIMYCMLTGKETYILEDTFLRCIVTNANNLSINQKHYQTSCGYIFDDLTAYYDATHPSRMEQIINSDFSLTQEQIARAKNCIKKIIDNKISKYNSQPIYTPEIGRKNVPKVLVIDQSYGDFSISKGLANDLTFEKMLDCAIKENPNADILIKTHPDTLGDSKKPKCYYQNVKEHDNIYKITYPINPISIIEYVDKVYVCSSQFGFEALMCGKEVHTFGMPFYANWGLTIDDQKCPRRTNTRTLEELFYIAYIVMSQYINPKTNKPCEIEEAIDYLIELREEYFRENKL